MLAGKLKQKLLVYNSLWQVLLEPAPFNILSMIWMKGSSAPSVSLQTASSWMGALICSRVGRLYRGIQMNWIHGSAKLVILKVFSNLIFLLRACYIWLVMSFLSSLKYTFIVFTWRYNSLFHTTYYISPHWKTPAVTVLSVSLYIYINAVSLISLSNTVMIRCKDIQFRHNVVWESTEMNI